MKQLSDIDAFFLHGETPKQPMNLSGVGIYDPATRGKTRITFADVLRYGAERSRRSPLFRRRLVKTPWLNDHPYWAEDSDFDIRNHVFHLTLDKPGTREKLDDAVAHIHSRVVDREGPLWEWWFIDGLDGMAEIPKGSFALLFKLHHAAFDGVAAWEVINVSHDLGPGHHDDVMAKTKAPTASSSAPSRLGLALNAYKRALRAPFSLAKIAWDSMPIARKLITNKLNEFPLHAKRAPKTPFNAPLGTRRNHRKVNARMADVKAIRQLVPGATVNDVVLAIIGGALRQYLNAKGGLPDKSLNVGMPVSIRAKGDAGDAGNQAMLAIVQLGTDIADPIERLRSIHHWTTTKKDYVNAIPSSVMMDMFEHVPGIVMRAAVKAFTGLKAARVIRLPYNLVVTNVPASRVPIYFAGARMIEYDACGPLWDGVGLIHVTTSYLDVLHFSFNADADLLPDPDQYADLLRASLEEMSQLASSLSDVPRSNANTGGAKALSSPKAIAGKKATAGKKTIARKKAAVGAKAGVSKN